MIIKCIKCNYELTGYTGYPTEWVVCPKCQMCDFYFTIWLKNHNMSFNEARRKIRECPGSIPLKSTDILDGIEAAEYARSSIGNISGWALSRFVNFIKEQTGVSVASKTPPLIGVNKIFLEKTRAHTKCCSETRRSHPYVTGINIPMMQCQNQYVGHSTLFAKSPTATEGFVWRTYLHNFYRDNPKGFLSYRPGNPGFSTELLLIDGIQTYLKALGWFDVQSQKPSNEFPRDVFPVLILGKYNYALDMLFDYLWEPWRITVLASNPDIGEMVWDRMHGYSALKCAELRVMPDKGFSGYKLRKCQTRQDVEDLVSNNFTTLGGTYADTTRSDEGF